MFIKIVIFLAILLASYPSSAQTTAAHQNKNDGLWDDVPTVINQAYFEKRYASMKDMTNKVVKRNHSTEVKSFINECYIKETKEKCRIDHAEFGAAYIYAFRGNYQAQRNVAFYLSQGSEGINKNQIQGCAWRIVILASGDHHVDDVDVGGHRTGCSKLTPVEHNAARARAEELTMEIYGSKYIPPEF